MSPSMTTGQALDLMGGFYPPTADEYETERAFYKDLKAYFKAFLAAADEAGHDTNTMWLLAGFMPEPMDSASRVLSSLNTKYATTTEH